MTPPRRRTSTGTDRLDDLVDELVDEIAPRDDLDLLREMFVECVRMADVDVERLDLKIAAAALREMRRAFAAFAPVRGRRKVTVFGSARTVESDPLFLQARDLASQFADRGWMVVTGAGPGIMLAAMVGAGREDSFGVSIRLPLESEVNEIIAGDPKLVSMKYFFTRKLMLMKESSAFVAMPGGFGTLDETMELMTLQQTGKAMPAPIVLLDVPGGTYWTSWRRFIEAEVADRGYADPEDLAMVEICDDDADAVRHVEAFYDNYRSMRWVGEQLVIRLDRAPSADRLARLNQRFGAITTDGLGLRGTGPFKPERDDEDDLAAARVALRMNPSRMAGLHPLIAALNGAD